MTKVIDLDAQKRDAAGKGAARKARKDNLVPAVIYGNKQDPISIAIPLNLVVKYLDQGGFKQAEVNISVDGKVEKVKVQALQLHPVRHMPHHIDFLRVA